VRGGDRPTQQRGVQDAGLEAGLGDELAGVGTLGATLVGEVDVDPSGELVGGVPLALPVTEQDQRALVVVAHGLHCATGVVGVQRRGPGFTRLHREFPGMRPGVPVAWDGRADAGGGRDRSGPERGRCRPAVADTEKYYQLPES